MTPKPPSAVSHPVEEIYLAGLDRIEELRCEAMVKDFAMLEEAMKRRDDDN